MMPFLASVILYGLIAGSISLLFAAIYLVALDIKRGWKR